jgi:hypothetical protein
VTFLSEVSSIKTARTWDQRRRQNPEQEVERSADATVYVSRDRLLQFLFTRAELDM